MLERSNAAHSIILFPLVYPNILFAIPINQYVGACISIFKFYCRSFQCPFFYTQYLSGFFVKLCFTGFFLIVSIPFAQPAKVVGTASKFLSCSKNKIFICLPVNNQYTFLL